MEAWQSHFFQLAGEFDPETEDIRVRIQGLEPLEAMAARKAHELVVFIDSEQPIPRIAQRLEKGEGAVSVVLLLGGREVEMRLPGQYRVTPQIRGAIRAVPGVVEVHAR